MPTVTTTVTSAEATGATTTVTTTEATPDPAPAAAQAYNPGSLTFRYWSCQGRGQLARYMLYDSGIEFVEDVTDTIDVFGGGKWPELKANPDISGRFGALPVVQHKGATLNETGACCQYIAEVCGYMPADALGRAKVVMVLDHCYEDVVINLAYCIWEFRDWDRDCLGSWAGPDKGLPLKYTNLENILADNANGYAYGASVTLADFAIFYVVDLMLTFLKSAEGDGAVACELLFKNKPLLLKHHAMMDARPNIVAHKASAKWADYGRFLTGKGPFGEGTVDAGMGKPEAAHWSMLATKLKTLLSA